MERRGQRPNLVLIPGGATRSQARYAGPVTRMGLWNRFPRVSRAQMTLILASKLILLAIALLYFLPR